MVNDGFASYSRIFSSWAGKVCFLSKLFKSIMLDCFYSLAKSHGMLISLFLMCAYIISQEFLAQEKTQVSSSFNPEVFIDELMDLSTV